MSLKHWIFLFLTLALFGCSKPPESDTTTASISGYNFMSEGVQEFYVDEAWGSNIGIGGGGGQVCCVIIPKKWNHDLQVSVKWRRSDCGGVDKNNHSLCAKLPDDKKWPEKTIEKTVSIEPYSEPGVIQVIFLPKDEVKVYVSNLGLPHPDHPAKLGRARPLDKQGKNQ